MTTSRWCGSRTPPARSAWRRTWSAWPSARASSPRCAPTTPTCASATRTAARASAWSRWRSVRPVAGKQRWRGRGGVHGRSGTGDWGLGAGAGDETASQGASSASADPERSAPAPSPQPRSANTDSAPRASSTPGLLASLSFLRQQADKPPGRPNLCLADFVAPKSSGKQDWIGAFACTAGIGIDARVAAFEAAHDDYSAILLKALADRLAEAFAERLHQRVRREFWGYAGDESLDNDALIDERYRGIRPAPGYPACPDHTEKRVIFDLLQAETNAGMALTESYAMTPAAAVSGLYFAHPDSQYFVVGRVSKEQVEDYAHRRGQSLREAERWLAPVLDYDPDEN
ncbi:MAG: hypothetical protein IPK27_09305 [Rhodanobacteraceae bacterium]|nr:hypothetical protein [Rhodanobacteraceae bacterium]